MAVPSEVVPSKNTTVPVGVPEPDTRALTVTVNIAQATPSVTSVNPVSINSGAALDNTQLTGAATAATDCDCGP